MPSIGGTTVLFIKGLPSPKGEVPEDITRPGVDGLAVRQTGQRYQPFVLVVKLDIVDKAALHALRAAFYAMRGTLVTVVDDYALTCNHVLVEDVVMQPPRGLKRSIGGVNGSSATLMTETRFTCRLTEDPTAP